MTPQKNLWTHLYTHRGIYPYIHRNLFLGTAYFSLIESLPWVCHTCTSVLWCCSAQILEATKIWGATGSCMGVHSLLLPAMLIVQRAAILPVCAGAGTVPEQSTSDSSETSADKTFCLVYASGASLRDHFYVLLQLPCHSAVAWSIAPAVLTGTSLCFSVSTLIKTPRQKQAAVWSEAGRELYPHQVQTEKFVCLSPMYCFWQWMQRAVGWPPFA